MNHAIRSLNGPATKSAIGRRVFVLFGAFLAFVFDASPGHADTKQVTLSCQPGSQSISLGHMQESVKINMGDCFCAKSPAEFRKMIEPVTAKGVIPSGANAFSSTVASGQRETVTLYCITLGQLEAYRQAVHPSSLPLDPAQGGFDPIDTDAASGGQF